MKNFGALEVLRSVPAPHTVCTTGSRQAIASMLRVRAQAPDGAVVGGLVRGARVTVTQCTGAWAEIGPGRWVNAFYLVPAAPPEVRAAHCSAGPHYIDADALNVRTSPVSGEILGLVTRGEYVPVYRCDGDWAEVGKGRWVYAGYLTTAAPARPRPQVTAQAAQATPAQAPPRRPTGPRN